MNNATKTKRIKKSKIVVPTVSQFDFLHDVLKSIEEMLRDEQYHNKRSLDSLWEMQYKDKLFDNDMQQKMHFFDAIKYKHQIKKELEAVAALNKFIKQTKSSIARKQAFNNSIK